MIDTIKPTKRTGVMDRDDESRYEHPAFGTVTISRISGKATLFQSELQHQHYIQLRIGRAVLERGLGRDWVFGDQANIIEVSMSEAQWASMVSSIGMGSGTPCTIERAPAIGTKTERMPYIDPLNKIDMASEESVKRANDQMDRADFAMEELDKMLAGKTIKKSELRDLRSILNSVLNTAKSNFEFSKDQFTEHMENTVAAAKSEVEGHVLHLVQRHGLESLKKDIGLIE